MEESWRRNHERGIMEEESCRCRHHAGGVGRVMEEESWMREIMDKESWMRNHRGVMGEESWRRDHGR